MTIFWDLYTHGRCKRTSIEAMSEEFELDIKVDDIKSLLIEDLAFISCLRYEYGL